MCRVLQVSKSGYYAWKSRAPSCRVQEDNSLAERIRSIYAANRRVYGSPRIHKALKGEGSRLGRKRVARLMRMHGIVAEPYRRMKWKRPFKTALGGAPDLVKRQFSVLAPNRVWVADITTFWSLSGWVHLAVVMDLYSRRIIGWAMHGAMTEKLVIDALDMAITSRQPRGQVIHHSDRGSQYKSQCFQEMLKVHGIALSMSRPGNCWDNAVIESFFKTLKAELQNNERFASREEAKSQLFEYIEVFYNRQRMHSTLGYKSPAEFERLPRPVSTKAG